MEKQKKPLKNYINYTISNQNKAYFLGEIIEKDRSNSITSKSIHRKRRKKEHYCNILCYDRI